MLIFFCLLGGLSWERGTAHSLIMWGDNVSQCVIQLTEKCPLSMLTSVHIKRVNLEKMDHLCIGTNKTVQYVSIFKQLSVEQGSTAYFY